MALSDHSSEYERGLLEGEKCPDCAARARFLQNKPRRAYLRPLIAIILILIIVLPLSWYKFSPQERRAPPPHPEHQHSHDAHSHPQQETAILPHNHHESSSQVKHVHPAPVPQPNVHYRHTCGNSIEEAKARGCTWDPLAVMWLPRQCTRSQTQEYLDAAPGGAWIFKAKDPVTGKAAATVYDVSELVGNLTYFSTEREHLTHCAYLLLRGSAARMDDSLPIDALSMDFHHQKHCAEFILSRALLSPTVDRYNTDGDVKFGKC